MADKLLTHLPKDARSTNNKPAGDQPSEHQTSAHQSIDHQTTGFEPSGHHHTGVQPSEHQSSTHQSSGLQSSEHQSSEHQSSGHQSSEYQTIDNQASNRESASASQASQESGTMRCSPSFNDGDVLIQLAPSKEYQVHTNVLRRVSPVFAKLLAPSDAANLSSKALKAGAVIRYGLQFVRDGNFARMEVNKDGLIQPNFFDGFNNNGLVEHNQVLHMEWLFGVWYGKAPGFDYKNFSTTVTSCVGLITAAENVDAVNSVQEVIDLTLLRTGNELWECVANNPIPWTNLGRRIQSPSIYKDGIIHTVGRWNEFDDAAKSELNAESYVLCQTKFNELETAKEVIEMRILGHYPAFLCHDAVDKPGRANYSNDVYMWMAICFFRQWFAQAISDGRNRVNKDGGCKLYNSIGLGGASYLAHETFQNFHQYFPMSSKACNVLEGNMTVLKDDLKIFVRSIMVNNSKVDRLSFPGLKWMTCCKIADEDLPWFVKEKEPEQKQAQAQEAAQDRDIYG